MTGRALKIGLLSAHNPYDRTSFSGTIHYMMSALQRADQVGELVVLGGYDRPVAPGRLRRVAAQILRRAGLARPPAPFDFRPEAAAGLDAVIAPVSGALVAQYGAQITSPILLTTDATPQFLRDFYGRDVPQTADATEAAAFSHSRWVVYSSHFMAAQAQKEFPDLPAGAVSVIPFGINLDDLPAQVPDKPEMTPLRLLFVGVEWDRKGGDLAIAALDALLAAGVAARLSVVGADSPRAHQHPNVDVLGYLDKNNPDDNLRLKQEFRRAHVFVLPTRADCTPMVVAEANAYGCPVVIADVGGISTLVSNGVNGQMLPLSADGPAYARVIQDLTGDVQAYQRLSRSGFEFCHAHLTWEAWADSVVDLIETGRTAQGGEGAA